MLEPAPPRKPAEHEALIFLRAAITFPRHLEKLYPSLLHSEAWEAMQDSVRCAIRILEENDE